MTSTGVELCEHDEIEAACLDCFGKPRKLAPQAKATQRTTKTPSSANDSIAPFTGDLDMSMVVDDIEGLTGETVLPARIFPHHLRRGGWVYLRSAEALEARVKAKRMVWNDKQSEPGLAIEVDPSTWTTCTIPLGPLAVQQQSGYRYLVTHEDETVTHYKGGKPVVIKDDDDED